MDWVWKSLVVSETRLLSAYHSVFAPCKFAHAMLISRLSGE